MPSKKFFPYRGDSITLAATVAFATIRGKPPWANYLELEAASATLEAITVAFGPKIEKIFVYDASLASGNRWQDITKALTDRNTGTDSGGTLNALQTGDRIYVACRRQFRGLSVDVVLTNGAGTAALVGEYPNAVRTFTDLSITDGTRNTASLDQDGLITWTMPTDWAKHTLQEVTKGLVDGDDAPATDKLFWMRLRTDTAFTDTSVSVAEINALLNTDVAGVTPEAEGFDLVRIASGNKAPYKFMLHEDIGCIELVSASITSAALANWYRVEE